MDPVALHARREPGRVALVCDSRSITYADLDVRASGIASAFRRLGVPEGGVVASLVPDSVAHIEVALAACRSDAVLVPIALKMRVDLVVAALSEIAPALVVAADRLWAEILLRNPALKAVRALLIGDPVVASMIEPGCCEDYESALSESAGGRWEAVGSYGSRLGIFRPGHRQGSAGNLEVMTWDAGVTAAARRRHAEMWGWSADDVFLLCGGAGHPGPGGWLQLAFEVGARTVVMDQWEPRRWLETMSREKVTRTFLTPPRFKALLDLPEAEWKRHDLSSLDLVVHGGTPCPTALKMRVIERFAPAEVYEVFGAVDTTVTRISSAEWLRHPGSVGKPLPDIVIQVLGSDGRPVPAGTPGVVHWTRDKRATPGSRAKRGGAGSFAEVIGSRPYVGVLDEDGYLYVTGRQADGVKRPGCVVYPWQVEEVIHGHRFVEDCAVFGSIGSGRTQQLIAAIKLRAGVEVGEIVEHCRRYLPEPKCPDVFVPVEELERDDSGNLSREALALAHRYGSGVFARRGSVAEGEVAARASIDGGTLRSTGTGQTKIVANRDIDAAVVD